MNPLMVSTKNASEAVPTPSHLRDYRTHVDSLRHVGQMFHARGWSVGTSSNYSVVVHDDPRQLLITASGRDKGNLSRGDFVLVDQEGRPVRDDQPKASAETLLHCLLAQDPEVGAVLHTHSVWATLLSDLYASQGGFYIDDYEMLKGLEGITTHQHQAWVAVFENSQDIPSLVSEIQQRFASQELPTVHGFLLRHHGLYTWGHDIFAATRHVEIFEFLFECIARRISLQADLATLKAAGESSSLPRA